MLQVAKPLLALGVDTCAIGLASVLLLSVDGVPQPRLLCIKCLGSCPPLRFSLLRLKHAPNHELRAPTAVHPDATTRAAVALLTYHLACDAPMVHNGGILGEQRFRRRSESVRFRHLKPSTRRQLQKTQHNTDECARTKKAEPELGPRPPTPTRPPVSCNTGLAEKRVDCDHAQHVRVVKPHTTLLLTERT